MADTKKPTIQEAVSKKKGEQGSLGTYQEAPGGGTPLNKGQKAPSPEWVAQHRVSQPRDDDGKFTYNAANEIPLKYGPSRGTTVPPFLRGDIKFLYAKKGPTDRPSSFVSDGKHYKFPDMSIEEFYNSFKEYMGPLEGFGKVSQEAKGQRGKPATTSRMSKDVYAEVMRNQTMNKKLKKAIVRKKVNPSDDSKNKSNPNVLDKERLLKLNIPAQQARDNPTEFKKQYKNELEIIKNRFDELNTEVDENGEKYELDMDELVRILGDPQSPFRTFKDVYDAFEEDDNDDNTNNNDIVPPSDNDNKSNYVYN